MLTKEFWIFRYCKKISTQKCVNVCLDYLNERLALWHEWSHSSQPLSQYLLNYISKSKALKKVVFKAVFNLCLCFTITLPIFKEPYKIVCSFLSSKFLFFTLLKSKVWLISNPSGFPNPLWVLPRDADVQNNFPFFQPNKKVPYHTKPA